MHCRNKLTAADAQLATLETEIETLEEVAEGDWGPGDVFWALKDKSFEQVFGAYTYKIKPFDKAEQDYTSLGSWDKWEQDPKTGQYLFKFSGGQTCWNGARPIDL